MGFVHAKILTRCREVSQPQIQVTRRQYRGPRFKLTRQMYLSSGQISDWLRIPCEIGEDNPCMRYKISVFGDSLLGFPGNGPTAVYPSGIRLPGVGNISLPITSSHSPNGHLAFDRARSPASTPPCAWIRQQSCQRGKAGKMARIGTPGIKRRGSP